MSEGCWQSRGPGLRARVSSRAGLGPRWALAVALTSFALASVAHGAPLEPGAPSFWSGFRSSIVQDRVVLDSLARLDVIRCVGPRDSRFVSNYAGTARGLLIRSDPRGVWLERTRSGGCSEEFVVWADVRRVGALESRPRTRREGWALGSQVGLVAGVVVMLATTRPKHEGDIGDLDYPITVAIGAVPFGLAGGLIGMAHPGTHTGWASCWP